MNPIIFALRRPYTVMVLVVALALTTPLLSAGSTLMTIDSPYTCCWGWALVCGLASSPIPRECFTTCPKASV